MFVSLIVCFVLWRVGTFLPSRQKPCGRSTFCPWGRNTFLPWFLPLWQKLPKWSVAFLSISTRLGVSSDFIITACQLLSAPASSIFQRDVGFMLVFAVHNFESGSFCCVLSNVQGDKFLLEDVLCSQWCAARANNLCCHYSHFHFTFWTVLRGQVTACTVCGLLWHI